MTHVGAGMSIVPELLIREVLLKGFVALASDEARIVELVERVDSLMQGSTDLWQADMLAMVKEFVYGVEEDPARVILGYPSTEARFPCISLVIESGAELDGQASAGDIIGVRTEVTGTGVAEDPGSVSAETVHTVGAEKSTTVQVGSWALNPEGSLLLHEMVQTVLLRDKGLLLEAGIRDIRMSDSGFAPDPVIHPTIGFVPMVNLSMEWTWRQNRRSPAALAVTVAPGTIRC